MVYPQVFLMGAGRMAILRCEPDMVVQEAIDAFWVQGGGNYPATEGISNSRLAVPQRLGAFEGFFHDRHPLSLCAQSCLLCINEYDGRME